MMSSRAVTPRVVARSAGVRTPTPWAFLAALALVACGDDSTDPAAGSDTTTAMQGSTSTPEPGDTTDPDGGSSSEGGSGDPSSSSGPGSSTTEGPAGTTESSGDTTGDATTGAAEESPPTNSAELLPWLEAGEYLTWAAESEPHVSAGPHGTVRTFINGALLASFEAGLAAHPQGAASVKELYTAGGQPDGWAVMVKVQPDSAGGAGWYWYELLGGDVYADGTGVGLCTGCHGGGGVDLVLTPFPLQ